MNRRDFILSTSSLLLAPSAILAQEPPKPATGDIVFADFESGTYDGWPLEGNCWTPEPYSDRHFPGKITGFQGKRFLCTYHPTRGNGATGKAVSSEFTIERPFINFLIGGGNHPSEACLNLLADGKIVRTATGNGSAEMGQSGWDVSLLMGKRARFEALDATQSADLGYIMVDAISMSGLPSDKGLLVTESGPLLSKFGLRRRFFNDSTVHFSQPYGDLELGPVFEFGITPLVHKQLIDSVCSQVYQLRHDPHRPMDETAKVLRQIADEEFHKIGVLAISMFLRQWMYAEAVCAYVIANVRYDAEIVEQTLGKGDDLERERYRRQAVEVVYGLAKPTATCDGFGRLTEKLAQRCGLVCWHIDGVCRMGSDPECPNHGWVLFEFDGGIRVPADTTVPWRRDCDLSGLKRKVEWRTLPRTVRTWELVLAFYYMNAVIREEKTPENLSLVRSTFDEWRHGFSRSQYESLRSWYDKQTEAVVGS